ncbi:hypothetical protein CALVIDRAFT_566439 [Calocera viscosa TUFC12733]|uniref:AB hydrolase-1 domain-containing protein n=1 Tax=Calocera viscosa (strain TUFC12733) TaxID=1330018 RepID=A0A167JBV0_CALVF|nr:hypothetical protein CALVIDRAFT_566439 [Calocera viscosa TUFC12733]
MSAKSDPALSLVFVHGFQGDYHSFQSFPTDLHIALLQRIPTLQTFVYPTYKARRSVEHATNDLLRWMKWRLPPGPVVLCGHSMGGILIAEAAFRQGDGGERVIGLINFDVPFLGVHPHVVISGLASLFTHEDNRSEQEMNDPAAVNMPSSGDSQPDNSPSTFTSSAQSASSASASSALASSASSRLAPPPSLHLSGPLPTRPPNEFLTAAFNALNLGPPPDALNSKLHWLSKHRSAPFSGAWRAVSETMEFAGCLMDPSGLWGRYDRLVKWGREGSGANANANADKWVNYWTETVPKPKLPPLEAEQEGEIPVGETSAEPTPARTEEEEEEGEDQDDDGYVTADEGDAGRQNSAKSETMAAAMLLGGTAASGTATATSSTTTLTSPMSTQTQSSDAPSSLDTVATSIAPESSADVSEPRGKEDAGEPEPPAGAPPDVSVAADPDAPEQVYTEEERKALEKASKQAQKELERAEKAAQKERERAERAERKEREAAQRAAQKEAERVLKEAKRAQKQALREAEAKAKAAAKALKPEEAHHFIVLPFGYKDTREWVRVRVAGVPTEVEAHCGVFFRAENEEYDWLVEHASGWVVACWEAGKGIGSWGGGGVPSET